MNPSKDKRIPEGPYFVTFDDAEDCQDHKHSGLAKVDTGRSGDWPIARLCEWPTAHMIASIPEMQAHIQALVGALEDAMPWIDVRDDLGKQVWNKARAALAAAVTEKP